MKIYQIDWNGGSEAFTDCAWDAMMHIDRCSGEQRRDMWLRNETDPSLDEHFAFDLGEQLFLVRVEDESDRVRFPGSRERFSSLATNLGAHACVMPMKCDDGRWSPVYPGWGLLDLVTKARVDPPSLVSGALIEMNDLELHYRAVCWVRNWLMDDDPRRTELSGHPSSELDPSIWVWNGEGWEWVVVRSARYPAKTAAPPSQWLRLSERLGRRGLKGSFASLIWSHAEQQASEPPLPIFRGQQIVSDFSGLMAIGTA